ncbi:unnamed protein product [Arabis nemorensis]|uniref:K Homology domain-containing protein n=1 Tax=Arabis nemorensis TaxID=586526 RepID=A0A565B898_9BRAS|nr:unnamed protein product [Arabis nemorensis]
MSLLSVPSRTFAAEMESNESYTADSPMELRKKLEDPSESDSAEKPTHIRFLVSKALAGSLMGKGGSTITEFQANSGARILVSRNGQYFPGTTDRIVVISGTSKEVYTAVGLVLGKLHNELQAEYGSDVELRRTRIVVPHSSAGCIIGKGGAIIKSITEYSKVGIKISPMDNTYFGLSDRLLTLSGTMEVQMRAIDLILNKLTEDDYYSQQVRSPNSYAAFRHVEICHRELVEGQPIAKVY